MERLFFRDMFGVLPVCFNLAGRYRFQPRPDWRYHCWLVLCLPFLLAGGKMEVSLAAIQIYGEPSLTSGQIELWRHYLDSVGVDSSGGVFTGASRAAELAADMAEN